MNLIYMITMIFSVFAVIVYFLVNMLMGFPYDIIFSHVIVTMMLFTLLLIGITKSPMWIFMKAAFTGRPIAEIRRKDGIIDRDMAVGYSDQVIETSRYGMRFISPKDPGYIDKKSGAKVYRFNEGIGQSISDTQQKVMKAIYNNYGWVRPEEVEYYIKNWHKCQTIKKDGKGRDVKCLFEGVPDKIPIEKLNKETDEKEIVGYHLECPMCKSRDNLKKEYPEMIVPIWESLDMDSPAELYLPALFSPDKLSGYYQWKIKAVEVLMRHNVMKLISLGLMIMLVLIGVGVFLSMLPAAPAIASGGGGLII